VADGTSWWLWGMKWSGDSRTSAKLQACWPKALRLDGSVRDPNALHMAMLEQVRRQAQDFDLMHFHLDYYAVLSHLCLSLGITV
jgi:hypothetical protein